MSAASCERLHGVAARRGQSGPHSLARRSSRRSVPPLIMPPRATSRRPCCCVWRGCGACGACVGTMRRVRPTNVCACGVAPAHWRWSGVGPRSFATPCCRLTVRDRAMERNESGAAATRGGGGGRGWWGRWLVDLSRGRRWLAGVAECRVSSEIAQATQTEPRMHGGASVVRHAIAIEGFEQFAVATWHKNNATELLWWPIEITPIFGLFWPFCLFGPFRQKRRLFGRAATKTLV